MGGVDDHIVKAAIGLEEPGDIGFGLLDRRL